MKYSSTQIKIILDCPTVNDTLFESDLRLICFDTRKVVFPIKSLFFAFKGPKNNGHKYVQDAYDKGIRNFVVSEPVGALEGANIFMVDDTLEALQQMAIFHRNKFSNIEFIAVTGSYGKTIVKDWLYDMLKQDYAVVKSPKSYNSQIGVALSILQIQEHHDYAIIEAGISEQSEMTKLEKMIKPSLGVFTNLGDAHQLGFESKDQKLNEKLSLFKDSIAVICLDEYQEILAGKLPKTTIFGGKNDQVYRLPFADKASKRNAQLCANVLEFMRVKPIEIQKKLDALMPLSMRLEIMKGPNKCIVINDAYIADVSSLEIALSSLRAQAELLDKTLIISDFELEESEKEASYTEVAKLIEAFDIDEVLHVGTELKPYIKNTPIRVFEDNASLRSYLTQNPLKEQGILIKGSRKAKLEELADFLTSQLHDTVLEINLSAIDHNIRTYSSFLKSSTEIIGVIKAGAYGTGSLEIAKVLVQNKIDYLAVAFTDEAIELRKAGITAPIIVLNSQINPQQSWIDYKLQPIVYSMDQWHSILAMTEKKKQKLAIHINLNTGMNRLGLEPDELIELANSNQINYVQIESVFTHLSSSEDAKDDDYSRSQIGLYKETLDAFEKALRLRTKRHVLNSSGIPRFPEHQMDAVRLGLGLYGINLSEVTLDLQKVHSLKSKIIQLKNYESDKSIGYNRRYKTGGNERIATIPVGYADGLPRSAGNGNYHVLINGQKAKIIGSVCMDLIMVNVSHLADVKIGDEVVIFDQNHPIEELAQRCGTIPYEILSNLSPRIKRIMIQE